MQNVIEVLSREHGHLSLRWDTEDKAATTEAREQFEKLKKDGYAFFIVPGDVQVKTWDEAVGELRIVAPSKGKKDKKDAKRGVAVPPMRGG